MEPIVFSGEAFTALLAYIFVVPVAIKVAAKAVALDAKLDPEPGEDETRLLMIRERTATVPSKNIDVKRFERSFSRRWLRAANYREEHIVRAIAGSPVDNCPRLTRAKRNLWRTLNDNHERAAKRKEIWRETGDNQQKELERQSARREIEAEINFHATITIDDVECERAIIAADGEGVDGEPETIIERDGVRWPDHYTILLGAGGVGFTKARKSGARPGAGVLTASDGSPDDEVGRVLDLPSVWVGYEDKRQLDGIEAVEFYFESAQSIPELLLRHVQLQLRCDHAIKGAAAGSIKKLAL